MPDAIDQALERHSLAPWLRDRIERLLDGREDERRLRCCGSGCAVCVLTLLQVLAEVRTGPIVEHHD